MYFCGAPTKDADTKLQIRIDNLGQLIMIKFKFPPLKKKSQVRDSNHGPPVPMTDALDHSPVLIPPKTYDFGVSLKKKLFWPWRQWDGVKNVFFPQQKKQKIAFFDHEIVEEANLHQKSGELAQW